MQNFLVTDKTNDFNSLWSLAKTIENNNNEQEEMSLNKISEVPKKSFGKETDTLKCYGVVASTAHLLHWHY